MKEILADINVGKQRRAILAIFGGRSPGSDVAIRRSRFVIRAGFDVRRKMCASEPGGQRDVAWHRSRNGPESRRLAAAHSDDRSPVT
jgi:hypothetical protein